MKLIGYASSEATTVPKFTIKFHLNKEDQRDRNNSRVVDVKTRAAIETSLFWRPLRSVEHLPMFEYG